MVYKYFLQFCSSTFTPITKKITLTEYDAETARNSGKEKETSKSAKGYHVILFFFVKL